MDIRDIPTSILKGIIVATEDFAGRESQSVNLLRRELQRRSKVTDDLYPSSLRPTANPAGRESGEVGDGESE